MGERAGAVRACAAVLGSRGRARLLPRTGQARRLPLLRARHEHRLRDGGDALPAGFGAAAQRAGHVQPGLHARDGAGNAAGGISAVIYFFCFTFQQVVAECTRQRT